MTDTAQMDLKKYWHTILRRQYLFISVSLIVLSVFVWGSFFLPNTYEAKSTVFIEKSIIRHLIPGSERRRNTNDSTQGLRYAMLSRNVLLKVIKEMDLHDIDDEMKLASMINRFRSETQINERSEENLFTVSFHAKDPLMAKNYINTLVAKYIETIKSAKREEAYGASKFLTEQINYYKSKIEDSEDKMAAFRREEGIYLATDEVTLVNSIRDHVSKIDDVEMEIKQLEAKRNKIEQQLSGEEPFTLALIESAGENSLPARLRSLEQRLSLLLTKYTDNYPEVIKTKVEIESIKKLLRNRGKREASGQDVGKDIGLGMSMLNPIYQQLKEEQLKIESEIDSQKATKKMLEARVEKIETELRSIPKNKKVLANLERDKNTYQMIYNELLEKLGQTEVNEQVELQDKGEKFKIVDPAVLPRIPVSPDRFKIIFLGIIAGFAGGLGAVILREKIDNSVRDIDELKSVTGIRVLAFVPQIITEDDIKKTQRLNRGVYAVSIFYLLIIGGVIVREFVNRFL